MICKQIAQDDILRNKYYLAGGTALALQFNHRKSYDLDFFQSDSNGKINFDEIYKRLINLFPQKDIKIILKQVDQVNFNIYGIKISFIAYPFLLIEPLVPGEKIDINLTGINLTSPKEIALMKAYAIGRRPTYRDYIDLYFLLKTNTVTIEYILTKAPQKFIIDNEIVFSRKMFLQQLSYTKDIDDKETALSTVLGKKLTVEEIEKYLEQKAKDAIKMYLQSPKGKGIGL
ncbi:nucleotidyl transferase AbiEii/AbiGii toxin family protein [Aceticella autotrophica]|uniref:Nucleotidyl transferase AbiEii/AbiGii toxin family protein n=2 Tax=Aceticella autotrophica TaxID=2755338 RepID=A0A975AXP4_9THEO|nr:nucleotidyl transferase AbiEii/AbiGii toxin family protein [Aceticella autotrophica]